MNSERAQQWHHTYMQIATSIASMSRAKRKVGAILVKDNRIISTGFNGTPTGFDNVCEDFVCERYACYCKFEREKPKCIYYQLKTKPEVLHAESNAIAKCARSSESSLGAILYTTLSPCLNCAKLIVQAGISQVYYFEKWENDDSGLVLLKKANIHTEQLIYTS